MLKTLVMSAALAATAATAAHATPPPPPPAPVPISLNELAFAQYGGGWVHEITRPDGSSMSSSLFLHGDQTYENGLSGKGPGPDGSPISAIGQGYWFARIGQDGSVEIALTRDEAETDPTWIVRPLTNGTLSDGDKVWTRGN